jgi:osmoprotectant transport system substrate-binding protein/osmoprotectant transport system permease protein
MNFAHGWKEPSAVDDRINAALSRLPDYLAQHVLLSGCALAVGVLISLPLAIAASWSPRLRWPILALASVIQTVPSLALLALFYPLLLAVSALSQTMFGHGFSALGFLPSFLALTLYAMLPIIRNTVTGLAGIDPDIREAAQGVGMTERESLMQIELPLAAPVIMAGLRTASIWVIGAATLSTPVGQASLGNYIFTGLQTENWIFVLFGCASAAGLALLADQLFGLIESGFARRNRERLVAGSLGLAVGVVTAILPLAEKARSDYVIGGKTFSEQYILSNLIVEQLARHGLTARQSSGLGSSIILRALGNNEIDAYVEYSGTVWTNAMGRRDNPGRRIVLHEVSDWLKLNRGVSVLGSLGFENAYALAMRRSQAETLGIRTIEDLAGRGPSLRIGGDYEFFARPEWQALRQSYGVAFKSQTEYQSSFMYRAVVEGQVDVISAFSSDGRNAAYDLVVLEDPHQAIPPYDALLLVAPRRTQDTAFSTALHPLVGAVSVQAMRKANELVDDRGASPQEAARELGEMIGLGTLRDNEQLHQ